MNACYGGMVAAAIIALICQPALATPLPPGQRTVLETSVREVCIKQLPTTDAYRELTKSLGREIAEPYCRCMAERTLASMQREDLVPAAPGKSVPPHIRDMAAQHAQDCMQSMLDK